MPIGSTAPGFTLPSLTGGPPVDLDALGRDAHRPVVLNFFASWCAPCQKETPLLARTAAAEKGQGVGGPSSSGSTSPTSDADARGLRPQLGDHLSGRGPTPA